LPLTEVIKGHRIASSLTWPQTFL